MTVTPEVIREILKTLDHKNDALWTDDGSPKVGEIQRLANDKTITRAEINEAQPGFGRIIAVAVADDAGDEPTEGIGSGPDPSIVLKTTDTPPPPGFDAKIEPEVNGPGEPLSEIEVRAILVRRIADAEQAVMDAKARVASAQADVIRAEQRHARAIADCQRKYPPISAAENIKRHLASQQEALRQRVEGDGNVSQIDTSMGQSNKRGWTRPLRSAA